MIFSQTELEEKLRRKEKEISHQNDDNAGEGCAPDLCFTDKHFIHSLISITLII